MSNFSKKFKLYRDFFCAADSHAKTFRLTEICFNPFCRKEQELSGEYFRFFIALKMKKPHWFSSNFFSKNLNFVVTFFAPPALTPRRLDLQKFAFNLFCRKEQELSGEYFRFFIALKMKELHWFSSNFFFKNQITIHYILQSVSRFWRFEKWVDLKSKLGQEWVRVKNSINLNNYCENPLY